MRWLSTSLVALALATAAAPAAARPPSASKAPASEPNTENAKVDAAIRAWSNGDWTRVRTLLEPLVQGDRNLVDPRTNESALRYLADATLQDEATLDGPIRNELATGYIQRLLAIPDWRPPEEIHGRQFYVLYNKLREQRDSARARVCLGEYAACDAERQEATARITKLQNDYAVLKKAFDEEEIEVQEKVARNRAVALIPFGVGHFYNGRKGIGAAFLASELLFGGVGLGLLIARSFNCSREGFSFRPGALTCQGTGKGEAVVAARDAEQTMGLLFVGTIALDIVIAQITFRPFLTVKTTRVRRQDLDKQGDDAANAPKRGRPGKQAPPPRSRTRTHDILKLSPAPTYVPGGGGFGLSLRF